MATVGSVHHSRVGQVTPKTILPSRVTELFQKVNWINVFSLSVVAYYLFYSLYKCYQLLSHSSLGLSEPFRRAKCRALLDEAQGKELSVAGPLLQQCETLIASMTDPMESSNKQPLVLDLALRYVKENPTRAYEIAQQLTESEHLIKVAEGIQKNHPNFDKLDLLWKKAFRKEVERDEKSSALDKTPLKRWLKFAEAFHTFGSPITKDKALEKALALVLPLFDRESLALDQRMRAWRPFAAYCQKTKNVGPLTQRISDTLVLIQDKNLQDSIYAHLELAYLYFYAEDYGEMQKQLTRVEELFNNDIATVQAAHIVSWVELLELIKKTEKVPSQFKNLDTRLFIKKAYESLFSFSEEIDPAEKAGFYLKILDACLLTKEDSTIKDILLVVEKMINPLKNSHEKADRYLKLISASRVCADDAFVRNMSRSALSAIQNLPESSEEEMEGKEDLVIRLLQVCSPDEEVEAIKILESLYGKIPNDDFVKKKIAKGMQILKAYNERNKQVESEAFFTKFIDDFEKSKNRIFSKINRLSFEFVDPPNAEEFFGNATNRTQAILLLEAAEKKLPQLSRTELDSAVPNLAQGFLRLDRKKALQILEITESRQATGHLITAAVAGLALGGIYFYLI